MHQFPLLDQCADHDSSRCPDKLRQLCHRVLGIIPILLAHADQNHLFDLIFQFNNFCHAAPFLLSAVSASVCSGIRSVRSAVGSVRSAVGSVRCVIGSTILRHDHFPLHFCARRRIHPAF